jgi:anti-sigma regulatory factor (Ser/Thr protein kinase)
MEFAVRKFDFENAGKASTEIKKVLQKRELNARTIRRIAIAAYELEMNQVVHSDGGKIVFRSRGTRSRSRRTTRDPVWRRELALEEGYSTANEWVRSLGFGAGMGFRTRNGFQTSFPSDRARQGHLGQIRRVPFEAT